MTKVLAFYLPQFHTIPENDEWWGKNFTEWVNVKKSKSLFSKHLQPRVPMDKNYYNILNDSTQEWQAKLAEDYGIGGFCYYHYWFNGRQLLEKPAEKMIRNPNIKLPFCFSWANEPWTRAWDGKDREVLMPQEYGDKKDWEKHFTYLLPFFKDDRYIKKDKKPVFLIYRISSITNSEEMLKFWDERAKQEGFEGIYFISMLTSFDNKNASNKYISSFLEFEPMYTVKHHLPLYKQGIRLAKKRLLSKLSVSKSLDILKYEDIWQRIIDRNQDEIEGKKVYKGAFVGWDNSPRKGTNALIINDNNPVNFQKNFSIQLQKSIKNNDDFLFLNAWNEWAEGTYLEPDEHHKYAYLQAIKEELEKVNNSKG